MGEELDKPLKSPIYISFKTNLDRTEINKIVTIMDFSPETNCYKGKIDNHDEFHDRIDKLISSGNLTYLHILTSEDYSPHLS